MLALLKSVAVVLWFAAFFAGERVRPASPPPESSDGPGKRVGRNLGLWACNIALSLAFVLPLTALAAAHGLGWRPEAWGSLAGGWPMLVADIVVLDLWIWAWHRANHEIPFLWRFHEVHHLDETLDASTALRFHFGEVALSACVRAVVIFLLGVPLAHVLLFETLVLCAAIFHHSNLALPPGLERRLSRVIITPSVHWVHHHSVRSDTDSRYGTIFSFWDPLFGTLTPARRTASMPIGVEGRREENLARLLARPFRLRPS